MTRREDLANQIVGATDTLFQKFLELAVGTGVTFGELITQVEHLAGVGDSFEEWLLGADPEFKYEEEV